MRIIEAKTAAEDSEEFLVLRGETVGVSAYGLAGAEEVKVQRKNGDGTFRNTAGAGSVMTVSAPNVSIAASGIYRVSKPVTVGLCGVDID